MRPITLNLGGIKDPVVLAALTEIQRASYDTLQNDPSSSGSAIATMIGADANQFPYFTDQYHTAYATFGHVPGTSTGDVAAAGEVGEVVTGSVPGTSPLSLTSATPVNLASISLSPGDWDVYSVVHFLPGATTNLTYLQTSLSITTGTPNPGTGAGGQYFSWPFAPFVPGAVEFSTRAVPSLQQLSVTTVFFLVIQANFTVSTMTARGFIRARRMR